MFFPPCLEDGVILQFPQVEYVFQSIFSKFVENFVWFLQRREITTGKIFRRNGLYASLID